MLICFQTDNGSQCPVYHPLASLCREEWEPAARKQSQLSGREAC